MEDNWCPLGHLSLPNAQAKATTGTITITITITISVRPCPQSRRATRQFPAPGARPLRSLAVHYSVHSISFGTWLSMQHVDPQDRRAPCPNRSIGLVPCRLSSNNKPGHWDGAQAGLTMKFTDVAVKKKKN